MADAEEALAKIVADSEQAAASGARPQQ